MDNPRRENLGWRMAVAGLGWFALVLQYVLALGEESAFSPLARTINFFSYFTVLSNILVALAMTLPWLAPQSRAGRFFGSAGVRMACAAYIALVAIVYVTVLRQLWSPQGWQFVADLLLHHAIPLLYVIDWLLLAPKDGLRLRHTGTALVFPAGYFAWTIVHGAWTGFYPYPFVDVAQHGLGPVMINAAVITLGLAALCLLMVLFGRRMARRGVAT